MRTTAFLLALLAAPAFAGCPEAPDHQSELEALFDAARAAETEAAARQHANAMWAFWTDAPDEPAQELLDAGMEAIRYGDYLRARDTLDRLVDYCPAYAEGWNQRAFVHFLSGEHDAALSDLEQTIALDPNHIGALSGLALTLTALGREEEAQGYLRDALALNPWISERHLLKEPAGTDL